MSETRLSRLTALADECRKVYDPEAARALDTGDVPRYACLTHEGSMESIYADNPDLTVYETLDDLGDYIASTLEEGWPPRTVIDLETGQHVAYRVNVVFL